MPLPIIGRMRHRPIVLPKDEALAKAVQIARGGAELALLPEHEREQVGELVKAFRSTGTYTPRPGRRAPNGPVPATIIAEQVARNLAPSSSVTPPDIVAAMERQGLTMVLPFAPGQPLTPYYGYNKQPRQYDYKVDRNVTTQVRDDRIPFATLLQLYNSYDVAQTCTRYSINDLRSMRKRVEPMDGYEKEASSAIAEANKFLRRPDGNLTFKNWIAQNMYNLWRFDSAPIFRYREGGKLKRLVNISALTLAPMVDFFGMLPEGDAPAFEQFIQGVPWDWLSRDDIIYEPFWPETDSPYGTPPLETVLINANCYSSDTEVLTERGWKKFAEVDITTDRFATRNPGSGAFEWQTASKYYEAPGDGVMYHAHSKNMDVLVTAGHRMLVNALPSGCDGVQHGRDWLVQAEDLFNYQHQHPGGGVPVMCPATSLWDAPDMEWFTLPTTPADLVRMDGDAVRAARQAADFPASSLPVAFPTLRRAEKGLRLRRSSAEAICGAYGLSLDCIREDPHYFTGQIAGDDFAAFMGMWLSEGSVRTDACNISVAQMEFSKGYVEFRDLLARILGREAHYAHGQFVFGHTALANYLRPFGKADQKYVPAEILGMSRRQLEIFWHFYVLGDGQITPGNEIVTTVSRRMADGLQEVLQKIGLSAAVRPIGKPAKPTHHQRWQVQARGRDAYRIKLDKVEYEGNVYCVSVPNKTLYVRRNGYPAWCANTDVRLQVFFMDFFRAGSVPEMLAIAPPDMTDPDSIADLQETYTAWTQGDQSERWGLRWLPHGTELKPYKPDHFDPQIAEYVERRTIAAFGLTPQNLGILDSVNKATSDTQMDQQFRVSSLPIVGYYEDLLDAVLQDDLSLPVQVRFDTGREKEDRLMEAQAHKIYVSMGAERVSEVRSKILGYPVAPDAEVPLFFDSLRLGPVPMKYLLEIAGEVNPATGMPNPADLSAREFIVPGMMAPDPLVGTQPAQATDDKSVPNKPAPGAKGNAKKPAASAKVTTPAKPVKKAGKKAQAGDSILGGQGASQSPQLSPSADDGPGYGDLDGADDQSFLVVNGSSGQGTGIAPPSAPPEQGVGWGGWSAERNDLRKWRSNARKAVANGRSPRPFAASAIRPEIESAVWKALDGAKTREDVDAAFQNVVQNLGEATPQGNLPAVPVPVPVGGSPQSASGATGPIEVGGGERQSGQPAVLKGAKAAGLVVQALDTGRVLMVQRTPDKHDPAEAYARWEWPGGKLDGGQGEPDASPWTGAVREWSEETGAQLPPTFEHAGNWTSPDGVYVGFVVTVPRESDLVLSPQPEEVSQARWWHKDELDDPTVRDKVTDTLDRVRPVLKAWHDQPRGHDGKWRTAREAEWSKFHRHADTIIDHYAPQMTEALADVFSPETIAKAIEAGLRNRPTEVHKAGRSAPQPAQQPSQSRNLPPNQAAAVASAGAGTTAVAAGTAGATAGAAAAAGAVGVASAIGAAGAAGLGAAGAVQGAGAIIGGAAAAVAVLAMAPKALSKLRDVLRRLYGDAYMQGAHEAAGACGGEMPSWTATVPVPDGYWDHWRPGVGNQAAQSASGGLADVLAERDHWASEMARTTQERIGQLVQEALANGTDEATLRAQIDAYVHDRERAWMCTDTEWARASARGQMDAYLLARVPMVNWLAEPTACWRCKENEAASPQPTYQPAWPQGPIPVHPNERCAYGPWWGEKGRP